MKMAKKKQASFLSPRIEVNPIALRKTKIAYNFGFLSAVRFKTPNMELIKSLLVLLENVDNLLTEKPEAFSRP